MPTSLLRKQAQRGEITCRLTEPMGRILRGLLATLSLHSHQTVCARSQRSGHTRFVCRGAPSTQRTAGTHFMPAELILQDSNPGLNPKVHAPSTTSLQCIGRLLQRVTEALFSQAVVKLLPSLLPSKWYLSDCQGSHRQIKNGGFHAKKGRKDSAIKTNEVIPFSATWMQL